MKTGNDNSRPVGSRSPLRGSLPPTGPKDQATLVDRQLRARRWRFWSGEPKAARRALGLPFDLDPDLDGLAEQLHALGWMLTVGSGHRRWCSVGMIPPAAAGIDDWAAEHVHRVDGQRATLVEVRASWADWAAARRIKATPAAATRHLDAAGHRRTRWKDERGRTVTGYRDTAVTLDPGQPVHHLDLGGDEQPADDAGIRWAMGALAGLASDYDREHAYAALTGTPMRLCGVCGRLTIHDRHKGCR